MTHHSDKFYHLERIIIIANRLPFSIASENGKKKLVQNAGGLVSAVMSLSEKMNSNQNEAARKIVWVGSSDFTRSDFQNIDPPPESFDLYPVNIPADVYDRYYHGFSNNTLWPLFHYFPMLTVFKESDFEAYAEANALFLSELEKIIQPDDFIWVHDYQLLLLPQLIRQKFPRASIGFFLHIPFPSYEVFRLLNRSWRERLLSGMLGADLIGFHTNDYTQNFLKTARRLLGYDNTVRKILTPERIIKADAFPIGIDYDKFHNALDSDEVKAEIIRIEQHIGNHKLIFSVDRLDYTKGIMNRLEGIEVFLENNPQWHDKVICNIVVVPSRDAIPSYQKMKTDIEATVGRINGKYSHLGWRPIIYQYKSLNFEELIALYSISHVGLITPLRDGMNLVAKEYVTCQGKNTGVLILSEFAGAVAELGEAIIINPKDTCEIADAIQKALEMNETDRLERIERMRKRIKSYNVFAWADDFMNQLRLIKIEQAMLDIKVVNAVIKNRIKTDYQCAKRRIILLDYDGTLVPFAKFPQGALPGKEVISQLKSLCEDQKNTVGIVSGRDKNFLDKCFQDLPVVLVAEHGFFVKPVGGKWTTLHENEESEWKETVKSLMKKYSDRCYGSFIEEKESALVWHYRNSEPDFALVRSQELKEELMEFLFYHKYLQVVDGHKIIEIKKIGCDKGVSARNMIEAEPYDFMLAIGDDHTDEDLFKAMPDTAYTIKVGLVHSNARYNLTHQFEVNTLINELVSSYCHETTA